MLKGAYIDELQLGDEFDGYFILKAAQSRTSSSGRPFLSATISDCSGEMDAKVWDYSGPVSAEDVGRVIAITGAVSEFKGSLQVTISRIRLADEHDRYSREKLVPVAPIDVDDAMDELREAIASLSDSDYRKICEAMLERHAVSLRELPAAKSIHHSFLSGLLMHTRNMVRLADYLSELYADTLDRSLLIAGTCLHDIAKNQEFVVSELGLVTAYSVKGKLLGHLVMGAQEVVEAAATLGVPEEKSVLLQHMILSHHGKPETGAAVVPMCAESELLSYIDMIDSRMEIYHEAMEGLQPGEFSNRIFALDKAVFRHS